MYPHTDHCSHVWVKAYREMSKLIACPGGFYILFGKVISDYTYHTGNALACLYLFSSNNFRPQGNVVDIFQIIFLMISISAVRLVHWKSFWKTVCVIKGWHKSFNNTYMHRYIMFLNISNKMCSCICYYVVLEYCPRVCFCNQLFYCKL